MKTVGKVCIVLSFVFSCNCCFADFISIGEGNKLVGLPSFTDFGSDTLGQMPELGNSPSQPSQIYLNGSGTIQVQQAALGLNNRPVVLTSDFGGGTDYATLYWRFLPITDYLRFEATLSIDDLAIANSFNMLMWAGVTNAPEAQLVMFNNNLKVRHDTQHTYTDLGIISPENPFRVRFDLFPSLDQFTVTVDYELDGFNDNLQVSGLGFFQSLNGAIDSVAFSASGHSLAIDDVLITTNPNSVPSPGAFLLGSLGLGLFSRLRKRWSV